MHLSNEKRILYIRLYLSVFTFVCLKGDEIELFSIRITITTNNNNNIQSEALPSAAKV